MNTFEIKVNDSYNLLGTISDFPRLQYNFKWVKDEPGSLIYSGIKYTNTSTTMNGSGKILLFKNGNISTIQLPQFKSSVGPVVMDVYYDNGKLWLIAVDYNKKVHLMNINY